MQNKNRRLNQDLQVETFYLQPNKNFPNNPLPLIVYKRAIMLQEQANKAAESARKILNRNGWSNSWRNGIYNFHHYHSNTHECMAITKGWARVVFGGPNGIQLLIEKGDVCVLPAGTGHKCLQHSNDFLCVGAYPGGMDFDMNYGKTEEYKKALRKIKTLSVPEDPLFGEKGYLSNLWKN